MGKLRSHSCDRRDQRHSKSRDRRRSGSRDRRDNHQRRGDDDVGEEVSGAKKRVERLEREAALYDNPNAARLTGPRGEFEHAEVMLTGLLLRVTGGGSEKAVRELGERLTRAKRALM